MITYEDFTSSQAAAANRLIDYAEGKQLNYLMKALNGDLDGGMGYRYDWLKRGYIPIVRNIVEPIVEKSCAGLFNQDPVLAILPSTSGTPVVDARLNELLMHCDFQEFAQTWNFMSRLLRSTCVLLQKHIASERTTVNGIYKFDLEAGDSLIPTLLHVGNSVVRMNGTRTRIVALAYLTSGCPQDDSWSYRYIDDFVIRDIIVQHDQEIVVLDAVNEDGVVPAFMHYDQKKPRTGVWATVPEGLRTMQEMVNLHLTDMNFAMTTQKAQPLYTTSRFKRPGQAEPTTAVVGTIDTAVDRRLIQGREETPSIGGVGAIVYLDAPRDGSMPMLQHLGPEVDLTGQQEVIKGLIADLASDWSVNLKVGGVGSATSGFQLVVEEIDNLTLRDQRAKMFQASYRRLYAILHTLYPELTEGDLQVQFKASSLPVNKQEEEALWDTKIAGGRASVIDYLMSVEGLSREEAVARKAQIDADIGEEPENDVETVDEDEEIR